VFSEGFEQAMIDAAQKHLAPPIGNPPPPLQPTLETSFEQSNRCLDCADRTGRGSPCYWHVRVGEGQQTPANPYNPICLPRISFMSSEHGTGRHAGSSEGTDSQQISLFEN
jgi:hypothetical protein